MPTRVLTGDAEGCWVYAVGRVGFDSGTQDVGATYTGTFRTERFSPAGEGGLVHFRRIQVRVWHTGSFSGIMRVYVDGVQTQRYASGVLTNQELAFSQAAPTDVGPDGGSESIIEMSVDAQGTYVEVEIVVDSDDITGVFLPETVWVGHRVIRPGLQRAASVA